MLLGSGLLLVATGVALAGNGVGGVFNLGQINNVNGSTELRGATTTQQLLVRNDATVGTSTALVGLSVKGTGVWGRSNRVGVRGTASAPTGLTYGIYGSSASEDGFAGYFQNTSTTGDPQVGRGIRSLAAGASPTLFNPGDGAGGGEFAGPNGVIGVASDANGAGVVGYAGVGRFGVFARSAAGDGYAGYFENYSSEIQLTKGVGIRGIASNTTPSILDNPTHVPSAIFAGGGEFAGPNGVIGVASADLGAGVYGFAGLGDYAGRFLGDVHVSGTITKGANMFKIDHPLDPANKYLSHSVVESPDMMNVYNGNVVTDADGVAVVELPDYFAALNRDPRYQLTVIGSFADAQIAEEISDNRFTIRTEEPNVKVSWQVTGIRQDAFAEAHPIVVEEEKAVADRGRYLYPVEHGQPATMGIGTHVAAQAGAEAPSVQ